MKFLGRFLSALFAIVAFALPAAAQETGDAAGGPLVFEAVLTQDMINPATAEYIERAIARAEEEKAAALLIRIDTPGGMLQSTRSIVRAMLAAKVPIVTYVAPGGAQAGSAGVFITMAGHVAAMAPGTNIGAAHPVAGGGEDIGEQGGSAMEEKVVNDTRAFAEAIARERGRNEAWAAAAVTSSVSVAAEEALREKVIDLIAANTGELLAQIDGREVTTESGTMTLRTAGARVVTLEMTFKQKLISFLANPNIAYMLLTLGFLGLYVELSNPGLILPGVAGVLCLILGFVALQIIPFNAGGLALILLGIVLFVAEIFVPGFGLLTAGGVVALVLGGILLFDTPEASVSVDYGLIVTVGISLGIIFGAVAYAVARSFRRRVTTGTEGMLGKIGVAESDLSPRGTVFVNGEIWSAVASSPVSKGERVEVVAIDGLTIQVKPAEGGERA